MPNKPKISIIIPFYNTEKFLQEAIASVLQQTYGDWELLLVDDGSTDRSAAIAKQFTDKHPGKINYLEHDGHQNRGACPSRNHGIRQSRGKYVAFLDADDVWLPHKLEQQVAILDAHPEAGMVYGRSLFWQSWTGKPEDAAADNIPEQGIAPGTVAKAEKLLTVLYPLGKGASPCPSDVMVRREVLERIGGFEDSWTGIYQLYEDQAFMVKVYLDSPVFVAGELWDKYRQHADSCVARVMKAGHYQSIRLFFLNWFEEYLLQKGFKGTKIWQLLQDTLWPYRHPHLNSLSTIHLWLPGKIRQRFAGMVK